MQVSRFARTAACVLAAATAVAGCTKIDTGTTPGSSTRAAVRRATTVPHVLRIGDLQDISNLNPHLAADASLGELSQMTMAYLVRYDAAGRPVPELATVVPTQANHLVSADGLAITWKLRHGVRWSDGAPFNADDVVFSTNVVNNPRNNEIGRDGWDLITKIDEPDKYTVVYHLRKPYSAYLPSFFGTAGANPCILPKHLLGDLPDINHAAYNTKPVGIGPFRYVKWVRNDHVELEANPYYWRGKPKLQKVIYKFIPDANTLLTQLQTGEIDMWTFEQLGFYDRLKRLPGVVTDAVPGSYYSHIDFNLTRPYFKDRAVRRALWLALDRKTLQDKTQHGLGVIQSGPISPTSPFYTPMPPVPFDLARANALLDAAHWTRGADGVRHKDGVRLAFDFAVTGGQPDIDAMIELIRVNWQKIGVQISVRHYTPTLMFALAAQGGIIFGGKYDTVFFSWGGTPDGDLAPIYGCHSFPPNGENTTHYCDPKAQIAIDAIKATYDETQRKHYIAEAQRRIIADAPMAIMWVRDDLYSYSSDLTGWKPHAVTSFDDMMNVDI